MRVKVEEIQVGSILQKDIMGQTKNPIIPANTILNAKHIHILKAFLIKEVYIFPKMGNDELSKEIEIDVYEELSEGLNATSFTKEYIHAVEKYKREFQSWQSGLGVNMAIIRRILIPLIEKCEEKEDWIQKIHLYSKKEDYLSHHAIAVALTAHFISKGLGYDRGQSMQVAIAGCLADCGMAKISPSILTKMGPLIESNWNEIRKHPTYSYQMVKTLSLLKPEAKLAIFQHHERMNGSGYPLGEKGNRVHQYSQIIAIADVYHAMTVERPYKKMQSPYKTLQIMRRDLFGQFDISILKILVDALSVDNQPLLTE